MDAASPGGGETMAITFTLIDFAKLNGLDPQVWLTDVLNPIATGKINCVDELHSWNYRTGQ